MVYTQRVQRSEARAGIFFRDTFQGYLALVCTAAVYIPSGSRGPGPAQEYLAGILGTCLNGRGLYLNGRGLCPQRTLTSWALAGILGPEVLGRRRDNLVDVS